MKCLCGFFIQGMYTLSNFDDCRGNVVKSLDTSNNSWVRGDTINTWTVVLCHSQTFRAKENMFLSQQPEQNLPHMVHATARSWRPNRTVWEMCGREWNITGMKGEDRQTSGPDVSQLSPVLGDICTTWVWVRRKSQCCGRRPAWLQSPRSQGRPTRETTDQSPSHLMWWRSWRDWS